MTSAMLGAAVAIVRAWTRLYTWRLPPALRYARRSEIESDLWEFERDPTRGHGVAAAVHVLLRLLLGVTDDLGWRAEQAVERGKLRRTVAVTAAVAVVAVYVTFV